MNQLSQKVFESYQIRKTKKQKQDFTAFLQTHIPELHVQETVFPKCRNLIIGDPTTAKLILTAHYDTCPQLPFPNFITPKKPLLCILYSLVIAIPFLLIVFLLNYLLNLLYLNYWVQSAISLLVYAALIYLVFFGPANKTTANDNTSGVITLLEIYQSLSAQQKAEVCFVFFDNEEKGLLGSSMFRKKYKKQVKDKLLVNFDCVSDGDHFLLGVSKSASQKYQSILSSVYTPTDTKHVLLENLKKIHYPSDQAGFPMAMAVAALNYKKPLGYYMDKIHTKRDTVFQEENIQYLKDRTIQLIDLM